MDRIRMRFSGKRIDDLHVREREANTSCDLSLEFGRDSDH